MKFYLPVLCYLAGHLGVYLLALRCTVTFRREKPILLYHVASFLLLALWVFLGGIQSFPQTLSLVGLHGIYSLSFLELWALSDGGYSLRVLECAGVSGGCDAGQFGSMKLLGSVKIKGRLETLERWHLAGRQEDRFELTGFGRAFTSMLRMIAWPSGQGK